MKRVLVYLAITFVWSWSWWISLATSGTVTHAGVGWPTHLFGLLGPAIGAFGTVGIFDGRTGLIDLWSRITKWRVRWWWYALIVVTALGAVVPGVVDLSSALKYSGAPEWGLFTILVVLVLNGFGEEIGWRGFLADYFLKKHSTAVTAFLVWIIWGVWHVPLFWVVSSFLDLGLGGTIGWALGLLSGSIWLTWMYKGAGYSILIVALWHTAFNFSTATDATAGVPAAVISTLVMIASVVVLCFPRVWMKPQFSR